MRVYVFSYGNMWFLFVFYRPGSDYVLVCDKYTFDLFGRLLMMFEFFCLLFSHGVLPCTRWMFAHESFMATSCADLEVGAVLTANACRFSVILFYFIQFFIVASLTCFLPFFV